MKLTIDFESRATIDIKKCGGYVYAEHPDTEVLCLAVKVDDGPARVWIADYGIITPLADCGLPLIKDAELIAHIAQADIIEAHNATFERAMWREHMVKRRHAPDIPIEKWDDTAARAAMCALPRGLDDVNKALGVKAQKDMDGYKLMLKMSKPRALRKSERVALGKELGMTEPEVAAEAKAILAALKCDPRAPSMLRPDYHKFFAWHEDPDDFIRLCQYCMQDVEAEYTLSQALPELPPGEKKVWMLDQQINDRGILCDLESVGHAQAIIDAHEARLLDELKELTGLSSAKAVAAVKEWLNENGCDVDDLRADTVKDALKGNASPEARRVLEIRQSLSKSSTAKLAAFRAFACQDGRLRGMMMYHGAGTGRWTGKGPQPHNLPRGNDLYVQLQDAVFGLYPSRDAGLLESVMGSPLDVISSCLRGMLIAAPGHDFIACDYAAIEGRGLAWLAGEQHVIDAYVEGKDLYRVAAAGIYKIAYEQVDGGGKGKQRQVGKVAELACFGASTRVLTDSGWKAIVDVTEHDRLWDGVDFVRHSGVVDRGERNILATACIEVTPDHLFLTENYVWEQAEDLFTDTLSLKRAIDLATSLLPDLSMIKNRAVDDWFASAIAGRCLPPCGQMCETEGHEDAGRVDPEERGRKDSCTTMFLGKAESACGGLSAESYGDVTTRSTEGSKRTEKMRCPFMALGLGTGRCSLVTLCPFRAGMIQSSPLIESTLLETTNPEICDSSLSKTSSIINGKPDGYTSMARECRPPSSGDNTAPVSVGCRQCCVGLKRGARRNRSLQTRASVAVYDILNCGPRNRFFVLTERGPLIAHNCGYQGGWRAMLAFGADRMGMTEEEMKEAVKGWRESRPATVRLWRMLEEAAFKCVKERVSTKYRDVRFRLEGKFLQMILPSGRPLYYYAPRIQVVTTPWGEEKPMVTAMSVDGLTKQFVRRPYHGGLWTENCCAKETLVITNRGPVSIAEVTNKDLVWDGVSWVSTDGPIRKGVREVGKWLGVRITGDHLVLSGQKWLPVSGVTERTTQECLTQALNSVSSPLFFLGLEKGFPRCAAVPAEFIRCRTRGRCAVEKLSSVEPAAKGRWVTQDSKEMGTPASYQIGFFSTGGSTDTQASCPAVTTPGLKRTPTTAGAVSPCGKSGEQTGKPFYNMWSRCHGGMKPGLTLTESTTQRAMSLGTCALCPEAGTPETVESHHTLPTKVINTHIWTFGKHSAPDGVATIPSLGICPEGNPPNGLWSTTGEQTEVFDLLNCGPLNRFTILTEQGPAIIHNCVQAMCRDIMTLGLFRCDKAGYTPVLHVHDEIVAEVPEGFGSVAEMERIMSVVPSWAQGMPINAAGFRGKRYAKD